MQQKIYIGLTVVAVIGIGVSIALLRKPAPIAEMPTPSLTSINQRSVSTVGENLPPTDASMAWSSYTNTQYWFGFKHPKGTSVGSNQFATESDVAFSVSLLGSESSFNVEVQDPEMAWQEPETARVMRMPLEKFVQEIWRYNKEDVNPYIAKEVGEITQTTVGGRKGYQFILSGGYEDARGGYVLDRPHRYLFVAYEGFNIMIWSPLGDEIAEKILESFWFRFAR